MSSALGNPGLVKDDPVRFVVVARALFPETIGEALKDAVAAAGLTEEDFQEKMSEAESPARYQ